MIPDLVPFTWERPTGAPGSWVLEPSMRPGSLGFFVMRDTEAAPPLPVEFFARELLEHDAGNVDEVAAFMARYGLLVSHARFWLGEFYASNPALAFEGGESIVFEFSETNPECNGVGMLEACGAMADLQRMARAVLRFASCETLEDVDAETLQWLRMMDCTRRTEFDISIGGHSLEPDLRGWEGAQLTRAICNQMFSFLMDTAPARVCANEKCGRIFKRKRGRAQYLGHGDSLYCCTQCETAQRQREFRRRKKSGNGNVNGGDVVRR